MFRKEIRDQIEKDFERVKPELAGFRDFQLAFDQSDEQERICLKYYYAYMPVSDRVTYDPMLFLRIIRQTLYVRSLDLYHSRIPDEIFLNFVLQYRVNNENIEDNRETLFRELSGRIRGKSIYDAAVEINYWCLEKATYQSTDPRTVSPLTLMRNGKGRCGEESTFTVSALRSAGIPARQIYTPRWAHCDDNHAWVEAYVDGVWRCLGACEPEPSLDRGWFTGPAKRAMLIHTRVFSTIPTGEEVTFQNDTFTELNLTGHYAKTGKVSVQVENTGGRPVKVGFEVPNYCALAPIASLETDRNGAVSLTTGLGDLQLHVTDGERFLTEKIDVRKERRIRIDFSQAVTKEANPKTLRFTPPAAVEESGETVPDSDHEARIRHCSEIRAEYEKAFVSEEEAQESARHFSGFQEDISGLLMKARGNHAEIRCFLEDVCGIPLKYKVLLLKDIAPKDLTDSTTAMLKDHLIHAYPYRDLYYEELFSKYVLNPRIHWEMLHPYRYFVAHFFDEGEKRSFTENPHRIYDYIEEEIRDVTGEDYKALIASVPGTLRWKQGSRNSRKVLFVAICRSLGIPARFHPIDGELEYYSNGRFCRIVPYEAKEMAKLTLVCKEKLQYSKNYTIARLREGTYRTLSGPEQETTEFELEEGNYRVLTGNRLADGTMLLNAYYPNLSEDAPTVLEVAIPHEDGEERSGMEPVPIPDHTFAAKEGDISLSSVLPEKYNILAYLEPSKEPTEHFLNELMQASGEIIHNKMGIVLIAPEKSRKLEEALAAFPGLVWIESGDTAFAEDLMNRLDLPRGKYPIQMLVSRSDGDMVAELYFGGYHVGSVGIMVKNTYDRS